MIEVVFLVSMAVIAIIFSIIQDIRTHEVANWISFSLIVFGLGFRFFWSLFVGFENGGGFNFFYQGLIGLGIFFVLGNLFYYGKIFAGGDAKLMIALGVIIPFYEIFKSNIYLFALFIFLFLISGAIYGLIMGLRITLSHKKDFLINFKNKFKKNKSIFYTSLIMSLVFFVSGFYSSFLFFFGVILFVLPYFYFWAKTIDDFCMVKNVGVNKLREGDWLYKNIKIGNKLIKAKWDGLTKEEIILIQNKLNKVYIREGIPFTPVFLISIILLIIKVFFLG